MARQSPVSRLDQRMVAANQSGMGIQAKAHPEFDQPTTLDKMVSAAHNFWSSIHGAQKKPAPSVVPAHVDSMPTLSSDAEKYYVNK